MDISSEKVTKGYIPSSSKRVVGNWNSLEILWDLRVSLHRSDLNNSMQLLGVIEDYYPPTEWLCDELRHTFLFDKDIGSSRVRSLRIQLLEHLQSKILNEKKASIVL